jgi:hypothetical protein
MASSFAAEAAAPLQRLQSFASIWTKNVQRAAPPYARLAGDMGHVQVAVIGAGMFGTTTGE